MPLGFITAGVSAATGLAQVISGAVQKRKLKRPEYEVNQAYGRNVTAARNFALSSPGLRTGTQQLGQAGAMGLGLMRRSATDSSSLLQASALSLVNQARQQRQLQQQVAGQRAQGVQMVSQANQALAQEEARAFELNELNPYLDDRAEANQLIAGGMQNIAGGLQLGADAWGNAKLVNAYRDMMEKIDNQ